MNWLGHVTICISSTRDGVEKLNKSKFLQNERGERFAEGSRKSGGMQRRISGRSRKPQRSRVLKLG